MLDWFPEFKTALLDRLVHIPEQQITTLSDQAAENSESVWRLTMMRKAANIASQRKPELEKDNKLFARLFATGEFAEYTTGLILEYAQDQISVNQPKLRQAAQLLFTAENQEMTNKPMSEYQLYDKVQLLFNLFPEHLPPFVEFLEEQCRKYIADGAQFPAKIPVAQTMLLILRHH